jgi:LPXTG-motif cell wall-anchored protein
MNTSQFYIIISIAAFVLVVILFLVGRKRRKKLTLLVGRAWSFILAGVVFSEDRLSGYSLMGVGVALAVLELSITPKRN